MSESFRHLLVPLDGSTLAEAAIPAARHLAASLGAAVTLLHMIERHAPPTVHGQPHLATAGQAERYLADLAARELPGAPPAQLHVHAKEIDDVAHGIVDHAQELHVDLIVMCTHGAGGMRHGVFGTVAQRVLALGTTPVLLAGSPAAQSVRFQRILVPLDGDPDHEQGLAAVVKLRAGGEQRLRLLMVIPTWRDLGPEQSVTSRLLPGTTVELLDATRDPAQDYLEQKTAGMRADWTEVTSDVVRGDPVTEIVREAADFDADLIVLGTHGKTHTDAFWSGSVTPQVVHQSRRPLLLVPVHPAQH